MASWHVSCSLAMLALLLSQNVILFFVLLFMFFMWIFVLLLSHLHFHVVSHFGPPFLFVFAFHVSFIFFKHVHVSCGFGCVSCSLCPSVTLCCFVFVSGLCLQLHSTGFFCKKALHHFSKTFWLRSKASIANEQDTCHEVT